MSISRLGLIVGIIAGLLVTVVVSLVWPRNKMRALKPLVAAFLGVAVALLLMRML